MTKPVILGAGLAGLTTALALAPMPVILVSPRTLGEGCSSAWAQGGIAAAIGANDDATNHAADTIKVGNGLNNAEIVDQITKDAANVIERLIIQGVAFDRDTENNLHLGLEAAHSHRRIVHAQDATGAAIMRALVMAVRNSPSIEIIENATAQNILTTNNQVCAVTILRNNQTTTIPASHIVLATGGAAGLWRDTTNPHENWGGGLALAARAGALLGDLEFMQFHPTALATGRDPMPLISEAMRGEGAILIDETGTRFTDELQPRDILTRAIVRQIAKNHRVFLDARCIPNLAAHFPNIHALCAADGIDITTTPIPVRPAAHYHMGGVVTDAHGRTNVDGLWACGEIASTGLHGANRLASNSLLEAAHFSWRVAQDVKKTASHSNKMPAAHTHKFLNDPAIIANIRAIMSDKVGVIRTQDTLQSAIGFLSPFSEIYDQACVGLMIAQAALQRAESRGAHFRADFPTTLPTAHHSRTSIKEYLNDQRVTA